MALFSTTSSKAYLHSPLSVWNMEKHTHLLTQSFVDSLQCEKHLQSFHRQLQSMEKTLNRNSKENEETKEIVKALKTIHVISSSFHGLLRDSESIIDNAQSKLEGIYKELHSGKGEKTSKNSTNMLFQSPSTFGEDKRSQVFRTWFMDNLAFPFPSSETKQSLAMCAHGCSQKASDISGVQLGGTVYEQCQLWFINGRRRSGWTAFFRTFALSDTKRMQQLVDIFRRDTQENKVSDLELSRVLALDKFGRVQLSGFHLEQHIRSCRENWSRMMAWLQQPNAEEVGDWMDRIVIEARAELEAEEARLKEEKKTIDSSIPQIKSPVESRKKEIQAKKGITATRRSKRLRMQNSASHKRPAKKRNLSGESTVSTCSSLFDTQSTVSSHSSTGYDGMEAESP